MRIYSYGARPPVTQVAEVVRQLRLASDHQRVLVLIEQRRRQAIDHLYQHACPAEWVAFRTAEEQTAALAKALLLARSAQAVNAEKGDEDAATAVREAREDLLEMREVEWSMRGAWYAAKKRATPRLRRRLAMCDAGAQARGKAAYAAARAAGLSWGTCLRVAESAERAGKAAQKEQSMPRLPEQIRDEIPVRGMVAEGLLAVQLQKGLFTETALSCEDTRFRIEMVDAAEWQRRQGRSSTVGRNGRPLDQPSTRQKGYAVAWLRIGSEGRDPVWAQFPIIYSRPLPSAAAIKWVQVHTHRVGLRTEWQVQITVDDTSPVTRTEGPTLAVNLGWRRFKDGSIRVAYAVGSDGYEQEVKVPPDYVRRVAHVESLHAIRDRNREAGQGALRDWVTNSAAPPWLVEETEWIELWRSGERLSRIIRLWPRPCLEQEASMLYALDAWFAQERHLHFWEDDERENAWKMRREVYRCLAAKWATKYSRILVTDMDLRDFAERPVPEEGKQNKGNEQRRARVLAAPSELRGAIKNAASTRGSVFEEWSPKQLRSSEEEGWKGGYTMTCAGCGAVECFDAKHDVQHTCSACGESWDQDANHCRSILASAKVLRERAVALAATGEGERKIEVTPQQGRWQKRRSKKAEEGGEIAGDRA